LAVLHECPRLAVLHERLQALRGLLSKQASTKPVHPVVILSSPDEPLDLSVCLSSLSTLTLMLTLKLSFFLTLTLSR